MLNPEDTAKYYIAQKKDQDGFVKVEINKHTIGIYLIHLRSPNLEV